MILIINICLLFVYCALLLALSETVERAQACRERAMQRDGERSSGSVSGVALLDMFEFGQSHRLKQQRERDR